MTIELRSKQGRWTQRIPTSGGVGILSDEILMNVMRFTLDTLLIKHPRNSSIRQIIATMKRLDTPIHLNHKNKHFSYKGSKYTGEEVNYIGVGIGFSHFDFFRNFAWGDVYALVQWHNRQYGHWASAGEIFWARYGHDAYPRL